ncbi:22574_t:CDS:2, partial [Racocetra persica]
MSLINVLEIAPFLAFVLIMIQQLTAKLDTRMERLTADLTSRDATIVVEGQRILTM